MPKFIDIILQFYNTHGRHDLPWRQEKYWKPYPILMSEIMLQQTPVDRVIPYFHKWMRQFPNVRALANASARDVLVAWQGLGYNRRGLYAHQLAKIVVENHKGKIPKTKDELLKLPGIGNYGAGAVRTFAWNEPEVFIETNIRRVFIHHFFVDAQNISDSEILPFIEKSLNTVHEISLTPNVYNLTPVNFARNWYYALMDYGATIPKRTGENPNIQSRHYTKQSQFIGSRRQVRGEILRQLTQSPSAVNVEGLLKIQTKHSIEDILDDLESEGFVERIKGCYRIRG